MSADVTSAKTEHGGRSAAREAPGLVGKLLRLLLWLFISLLFSILVECAGMTWWWPDEGLEHSRVMLEHEIGYLSGDLRSSALVADTAAYAKAFADTAYAWLWQRTGLDAAIRWAGAPPPVEASALRHEIHEVYARIAHYVVAAATVTQVFAVRVAVVTLSMPAFGLAALMGALDGLVSRDLRRWGGGRESSFVYHHARRWVWPMFLLAWVLYLSLPFSLHPSLAILPFAAGVGVLVAVTTGSFKKHL